MLKIIFWTYITSLFNLLLIILVIDPFEDENTGLTIFSESCSKR